jgi:hypothetical protein
VGRQSRLDEFEATYVRNIRVEVGVILNLVLEMLDQVRCLLKSKQSTVAAEVVYWKSKVFEAVDFATVPIEGDCGELDGVAVGGGESHHLGRGLFVVVDIANIQQCFAYPTIKAKIICIYARK